MIDEKGRWRTEPYRQARTCEGGDPLNPDDMEYSVEATGDLRPTWFRRMDPAAGRYEDWVACNDVWCATPCCMLDLSHKGDHLSPVRGYFKSYEQDGADGRDG